MLPLDSWPIVSYMNGILSGKLQVVVLNIPLDQLDSVSTTKHKSATAAIAA